MDRAASHADPRHRGSPRYLGLWLRAIRDGFIALLPVTVAGVAANVLATLLPLASGDIGASWLQRYGTDLAAATMGATLRIMGLMAAMSIAYRLAALRQELGGERHESLIGVAPLAAAAFLVLTPIDSVQGLLSYGYASALRGVVVGLAVGEATSWFRRRWPAGNSLVFIGPHAMVHYAMRLSVLALLVLACAFLVRTVALAVPALLSGAVGGLALAPFPHGDGGRVLAGALLVSANQLLWLLGINGGQVVHEIVTSQAFPALSAVVEQGPRGSSTVAFLNTYAHLGGAGATWGLILACLLWSRDAGLRRLAGLSVLPALLNINEILLFGLPIVFGRLLVVPFLAAPLMGAGVALLALQVLPVAAQPFAPAWFTPVFWSGWLYAGGPSGAALQAVVLVLVTLLYRPYVLRLESLRAAQAKRSLEGLIRHLGEATEAAQTNLLQRDDAIGDVARLVAAEVQADLGSPRLRLAYQPQHDRSGRVIGVEALLRWEHRRLGAVPAGVVIHVAEECEAIHRIGAWVLEQACRDLAAWRDQGIEGITLSINMSPLQLEDPDWAPRVNRVIAEHRLDPSSLDIELTEGRRMSSTLQSQFTLAQLQAAGVRLSMDDFGMGYTSLLYMQRFDIHTIKLDGSLTRDVERNEVGRQIIEAVVHLGRSRGVAVVAEFVETASQRDRLAALGCDYFQGWLYAPAMAADAVPAYVERAVRSSPDAVTPQPMPAEPHPAG